MPPPSNVKRKFEAHKVLTGEINPIFIRFVSKFGEIFPKKKIYKETGLTIKDIGGRKRLLKVFKKTELGRIQEKILEQRDDSWRSLVLSSTQEDFESNLSDFLKAIAKILNEFTPNSEKYSWIFEPFDRFIKELPRKLDVEYAVSTIRQDHMDNIERKREIRRLMSKKNLGIPWWAWILLAGVFAFLLLQSLA